MKILHTYPPDLPQLAHYVSMLTTAMEGMVEMQTTTSAKGMTQLCKEWRPDIVHIHGVMATQPPRNVRTVVSPHGTEVSLRAYVVIARSPLERERLRNAGQQRIEVVPNPILTRTVSARETARMMMEAYQRVADSNVRELMDQPTLDMMQTLLKAGITGDRRWVSQKEVHTNANWRQLAIYFHMEGLDTLFENGIATLGITPPAIDVANIKTYLPDNYESPEQLNTNSIPILLDAMAEEIKQKNMSLSRIVELHQALLSPTLDEEKLLNELAKERQQMLARLLWIASEETLLDEGFMPLNPMCDRQAKQIYNLIKKHLKI